MGISPEPPVVSRVDFHFDVMCPYAYQTSLWIREVRDLTGLEVALAVLQPRGDQPRRGQEAPVGAGVVLRLVDDAHRRAAAPTSMADARRLVRTGRPGAARRGPQAARARVAEHLLDELGLDPGLVDAAIADPTTHDDVTADHDRVVAAGGFGVPTLFFPERRPLPVRPGRRSIRRPATGALGCGMRYARGPSSRTSTSCSARRAPTTAAIADRSAPTSRPGTGCRSTVAK